MARAIAEASQGRRASQGQQGFPGSGPVSGSSEALMDQLGPGTERT